MLSIIMYQDNKKSNADSKLQYPYFGIACTEEYPSEYKKAYLRFYLRNDIDGSLKDKCTYFYFEGNEGKLKKISILYGKWTNFYQKMATKGLVHNFKQANPDVEIIEESTVGAFWKDIEDKAVFT